MKLANIRHLVRPLPELRPVESGFWNAAVPSVCVVALQQHMGGRLTPEVRVGDTVREGSVIASGGGRFSSLVHAPIPGTIVETGTMQMADGRESEAVSISLAGEFDRLGKVPAAHRWHDLDAPRILSLIREGGVVCTGRTGLPVYALLIRRHVSETPRIILDLVETEPYVRAEFEVANTLTAKVLEGLEIAKKITGAEEVSVVLQRKRKRSARKLQKTVAGFGYTVRFCSDSYSAGLDHQLTAAAFGIRLLTDQKALDRNIFVLNATTSLAIYESVVLRKPQIDRVVTVAGGAVKRPANVRVRIGASVADIIEECGGLLSEPAAIILGGPLTGRRVRNINAPITKRDSAILALTAQEMYAAQSLPCVGCGACVRSCPVALDPIFLTRLIQTGRDEQALESGLNRCTECGLCSHVCPSRVPLAERIREARIAARGVA